MKNLEAKIKFLATKNKITLKELCSKIDMTEQNLRLIFGKNSIQTNVLEKIAKVFDVDISYFFQDTVDIEKYNISEPGTEYKVKNRSDTNNSITILKLVNNRTNSYLFLRDLNDYINTMNDNKLKILFFRYLNCLRIKINDDNFEDFTGLTLIEDMLLQDLNLDNVNLF